VPGVAQTIVVCRLRTVLEPAGHEKRWPAPQRIWFAWVGCLPQHAKITPGGTFTLLDSFDGLAAPARAGWFRATTAASTE